MNFISIIQHEVAAAVKALYGLEIAENDVICSPTRKEFEGDYTITVFSFAKAARKAPPQIGQELGDYLTQNVASIAKFNVIQGFLNLVVANTFWTRFVAENALNQGFGLLPKKDMRVMIEFSSPNTNKPLHLGHIRNILLGWSCSKILEAAGYEVVRTQVVNDRGIAICKSMIAWQLFGDEKTPDTSERLDGSGKGVKGDHFVGDYYVMFENKFKEEYKTWQKAKSAQAIFEEWAGKTNTRKLVSELEKKKEKDIAEEKFTNEDDYTIAHHFFKEVFKNDYFNKHSVLGAQAREMLLKWESGDEATKTLWQQMNNWVYTGFNETYKSLGVRFDKIYYESNSYLLGKDIIEEGLQRKVFYQKPDSSVWIDLSDVKLDQKLVLRSDGTSVYITQDIGMARLREEEFKARKVVYVVADEQNYHFQVLFDILKKLGEPYANGLHHLSYGMVELPTGRMKSREGTVVDADDLIAEVIKEAHREVLERGALEGIEATAKAEIERRIGVGAMKYHLIKVNPKKKMIFDPKESVDFEGHTGPYIQYAFVRSSGVVRDAVTKGVDLLKPSKYTDLKSEEKDLIQRIYELPKNIEEAAANYDPSVMANFCYELAKSYNRFWYHCSILRESDTEISLFRLQLSQLVATSLQRAMDLLGIEMPERM